MQVFEKQTLRELYDRNSGATFADLEFRRCRFQSCALSVTFEPARRSTARNIRLIDCTVEASNVRTAVIEESLVSGLKTIGLFQVWAAVFRHVTIEGRIGRVMLTPHVAPLTATPAQQRAFDEANAAFYESVDWALDISNAEFEEVELTGIPGHLIRRDPQTSVLITRDSALRGTWRTLDLAGTWWPESLEGVAKGRSPSEVLVAPARHRKFRRLMDGLQQLRDAGIAE